MSKTTRQSETLHASREAESRAEVWVPPSLLEAPPPREGMKQRWIRTSILGNPDPSHVARKMREGWRARSLDTVPESFYAPVIGQGKFEGHIGTEDMVLMETPEKLVEQRTAHFARKTGELDKFTESALARTQAQGGTPIDHSIERSFTRGPGRVAED